MTTRYKGPNHVETCPYIRCFGLVQRVDAVHGSQIPGQKRGWFHPECARALGYESREDRDSRLRGQAIDAAFPDRVPGDVTSLSVPTLFEDPTT